MRTGAESRTAPRRVGKYEIVRRLGRSVSDVYLAIDTQVGRETALKLVRPAPDSVSRMVLEAERRGAAIQKELRALDPRVIEVYEYGEADGYFFVAMQYVEGRNLAQTLQSERRLEPRRAARIAAEIAGLLETFHAARDGGGSAVVHGDIKPSNVHLGPDDTVRLLDFGIAKILRSGHDATMHNFGSPGYCSPERLERLQVDAQSDLWALGATLYEMLAGRAPYQAENTEKLEKMIQAKRPPGALPRDCPAPLQAITGKSLAPSPSLRYRSAADFRADLEAFLDGRPTIAEGERRLSRGSAPTLEVALECLRRVTRTVRWHGGGRRMVEASAWFVLGMGLWIGGSAAGAWWQATAIPRAPQPAPPLIPKVDPLAILRVEYLRTADRVIDGYRSASDNGLRGFDWRLAEASLARLQELGASDTEVAGKLALCRGFSLLAQGGDRKSAEAARGAFETAAAQMPQSPDPQLGLARLYTYSIPDLSQAIAAMRAAAALGYALRAREVEQQADGWRMRAEREFAAGARERARRDAQRARALYAQLGQTDARDKRIRSVRQMASARPRRGW
jgi:eukaryotic-like serine/threonine-protein kinase